MEEGGWGGRKDGVERGGGRLGELWGCFRGERPGGEEGAIYSDGMDTSYSGVCCGRSKLSSKDNVGFRVGLSADILLGLGPSGSTSSSFLPTL